LIIGGSSFISSEREDSTQVVSFAKSVGADVLIITENKFNTETDFYPLFIPTTEQTTIYANVGSIPIYGNTVTSKTQTTLIPITRNRYRQESFYLKNIKSIIGYWERNNDFYKIDNQLITERWYSELCEIKLVKQDNKLLGFFL